jgi:tetratricopeptide (TPR) repeat protein
LLLAVMLAVVTALAGCSNPEERKAQHISRGDAYLKEKKYQEASLEFRNALQIDDNSAAAHWGLAQAYEGLQRFQEMFAELKRTIELDSNNLDARVKMGNYYLIAFASKKEKDPTLLPEAERLAKDVLEKDQNHIEGHILMASVLNAQDKPQEALAELNRAIELDPKRIESYLSLARFYLNPKSQDLKKAEETYQRAISVNENAALAHMEYAQFLLGQNQRERAEAEFKKAVEVEPANRDARTMLAKFYIYNKQLDKAEEMFKGIAEMDTERPDGRALLADFYSGVGRYDEAIKLYQEIVAKAPDYMRGRYRLSEIYLQRGDTKSAAAQIDEILRKNNTDMQALLMRSRIRMQNGEIKEAIDDLKEVLKQEPNNKPGLYFIADAYFRSGQIDQARAQAADLERFYPDYLPAKLLQAQLNLASKDAKNALTLTNDLLDRLAKATPDAEMTPQFLMDLKAKALTTRATAQIQLKNFKAARADMQAALELYPNAAASYANMAAVSLSENKVDEAIQYYDRALAIDKANFAALTGLINVYAKQNRLDQAHARVDEAIAVRPADPSLHYLKAQIYGYQRDVQNAEAELRKAIEIKPDYLAAYFALGALYINTQQQDRAIAEYRKVIDRSQNATAYTMIGMLEDSRKNFDAAAENYRKALEIDPNNSVIAANNLAWIYAEYGKGNLDEAVRLAQGVVGKFPEEAGFADTLGWVYYKKGLYAAAVEQLRKATAKNETNPLYRYHLGLALVGAGDKEGAKRELEQALKLGEGKSFAEAEEARRALATL